MSADINDSQEDLRTIQNRVRDLESQASNTGIDLEDLEKKKVELELKKRRIIKKIQRLKIEVDEIEGNEKKLEKIEYELKDNLKKVERKLQEELAKRRILKGS